MADELRGIGRTCGAETWCGRIIVYVMHDRIINDMTTGEWVLVTASAGGVGIAACQLAKGVLC